MEKFFAIAFASILLSLSSGTLSAAVAYRKRKKNSKPDGSVLCIGGTGEILVGAIFFVGATALAGFNAALVFSPDSMQGITILLYCVSVIVFLFGFLFIRHVFNCAEVGDLLLKRNFFHGKEYNYEDITRVELLHGFTRWSVNSGRCTRIDDREKLRIYAGSKVVFRADEDYCGFEETIKFLRKKVHHRKWEDWHERAAKRLKEKEEKIRKKRLEQTRRIREEGRGGKNQK